MKKEWKKALTSWMKDANYDDKMCNVFEKMHPENIWIAACEYMANKYIEEKKMHRERLDKLEIAIEALKECYECLKAVNERDDYYVSDYMVEATRKTLEKLRGEG